MKKVLALVLALVICLSLAACGGDVVTRQDAIDAFNPASISLGDVSKAINADPDSVTQELIDELIGYATEMNEFKAVLEGTEELTEEELNEIIVRTGEIGARAEELKTEMGIE